jgi:protein-S-isoprenylcysteine O-methyltransferase Ste14
VPALRTTIYVAWGVFWIYWLVSAAGAKKGSRRRRPRAGGLVIIVLGGVLIRLLGGDPRLVHNPALELLGVILFLSGLGVAVWARVHLGRNWGMPMTEQEEPELVTSGPYRAVRHPIYSGLLLALLGTAFAIYIHWLIVVGITAAYFVYSAREEERFLTAALPKAYPAYRAKTKMLIPFVL